MDIKEIVLIIDDDPTTLLVHRLILKKLFGEFILNEFSSALLALDFLKHIKNPEIFHFIIFLDIFLPDMSGWEFLNELEKHPNLSYRTHIVTISNNPDDELNSKRYKSIVSYTEKPLTIHKVSKQNLNIH